jgi:predicted enzyme related to lactoylglutathione lyase
VWVGLGATDVDGACAFDRRLFGWEIASARLGERDGRFALLRGLPVAGIGHLLDAVARPWWTMFIGVDDVHLSAAAVVAQGGSVTRAPGEVGNYGCMAVVRDCIGASFALWQAADLPGTSVVDEPGTFSWGELTCRDTEAAAAFYSSVFSWDARPLDGVGYRSFRKGDRPVAGMIAMDDHWPVDVPSHWMAYFLVADCDATAARCRELGGAVFVPPTDIAPGRFAVLNDPYGAVLSIITPSAA